MAESIVSKAKVIQELEQLKNWLGRKSDKDSVQHIIDRIDLIAGVDAESVEHGQRKEMAKVYVITAGSYSDYHICAVSLDPKKAEVLGKFYTEHGYDEAGVEEYEADYEYDRIESGYQMYIVSFDEQGYVEHIALDGAQTRENVFSWGRGVKAEVWAKDAKAAVKIAAEKRAMYLAEKEGIT